MFFPRKHEQTTIIYLKQLRLKEIQMHFGQQIEMHR